MGINGNRSDRRCRHKIGVHPIFFISSQAPSPIHPSPTTMPNFLSSFIDQAQNAVQSSPLANKIPLGHHRPGSPGVQNTNTTGSSGSTTHKSSTLAAINHQFRTLKQQYVDSTPYQRLITASKGVVMDYDNVAKDTKAGSKELYVWGQTETEDLKDGGCTSLGRDP